MQAMRLDRINDVLNQKLDKYKHECKMQEEDREFLVRQLVAIKKENARLRREIEKIKSVRCKIQSLFKAGLQINLFCSCCQLLFFSLLC